jgi:hypothetical protein
MVKRILLVLAVLCLVAVVDLAREVQRAPQTIEHQSPAPAGGRVRVVVSAGVAAPPDTPAMVGAPEIPGPTVPTLATMPERAPIHPETIAPPNLSAARF